MCVSDVEPVEDPGRNTDWNIWGDKVDLGDK